MFFNKKSQGAMVQYIGLHTPINSCFRYDATAFTYVLLLRISKMHLYIPVKKLLPKSTKFPSMGIFSDKICRFPCSIVQTYSTKSEVRCCILKHFYLLPIYSDKKYIGIILTRNCSCMPSFNIRHFIDHIE